MKKDDHVMRMAGTVSLTGKKPFGFPRGELLSVGTNGANNYAICPVKVMAWIHKTAMTPNATVQATARQGRSPAAANLDLFDAEPARCRACLL